ncbi:hypothetical protein [Chitinophaga cymbidii]|nr:hypothetical protein [Chitinophaga cymbidii]
MLIKIVSAVLIIFVAFMGCKQGWAMWSGKPEMLSMFEKWQLGKSAVRLFGVVTLASVILILIPRTFVAGNFIMAATILLIICLQLSVKDLKGATVELPFMLLNLVIIYLQYPLLKPLR